MWERGLKHKTLFFIYDYMSKSLPMWERGLKHNFNDCIYIPIEVAPYVGAWIETAVRKVQQAASLVAPYVGAWIETSVPSNAVSLKLSLPMWERGLKLGVLSIVHDTWSRSLCGSVD